MPDFEQKSAKITKPEKQLAGFFFFAILAAFCKTDWSFNPPLGKSVKDRKSWQWPAGFYRRSQRPQRTSRRFGFFFILCGLL
jgi:hypothetical protein